MDAHAAFDWFWKLCAVATPFVVLAFNLRASKLTNDRKSLMESIDGKINAAVGQVAAVDAKVTNLTTRSEASHAELSRKVEEGNARCREDIEAVQKQVQSFQVDVATRYPTRDEFRQKADELRDEFRHYSGGRRRTQES